MRLRSILLWTALVVAMGMGGGLVVQAGGCGGQDARSSMLEGSSTVEGSSMVEEKAPVGAHSALPALDVEVPAVFQTAAFGYG